MTIDRDDQVEIPEDAVVMTEIHMVSYMTVEGTQSWGLRAYGDTTCAQVVGLLSMAKHRLLVNNAELGPE